MSQLFMDLRNLVQDSVRCHGAPGALWRAAVASGRMARRLPYLCERHVWYRLDLERGWTPRELPAGFEIVRGGVAELPLLKRLKSMGYVEGLRRLKSGAELWIIRHGGEAVFACWIFRRRTPVLAAPGGWLELPDGVVCREDSVTAPSYRGRGLSPASYSPMAERLAQEDAKAIICKIEETNFSSRRAVEKAGLRPVATMTLVRVGWMRHVGLELEDGEDPAPFLPFLPAKASGLKGRILGALAPKEGRIRESGIDLQGRVYEPRG